MRAINGIKISSSLNIILIGLLGCFFILFAKRSYFDLKGIHNRDNINSKIFSIPF